MDRGRIRLGWAVMALAASGCANWSARTACDKLEAAATAYAEHSGSAASSPAACSLVYVSSTRADLERQVSDRTVGVVKFLEKSRAYRVHTRAERCLYDVAGRAPHAAQVIAVAVNARANDQVPIGSQVANFVSVGLRTDPYISQWYAAELQQGILNRGIRGAVAKAAASPEKEQAWSTYGPVVKKMFERWLAIIDWLSTTSSCGSASADPTAERSMCERWIGWKSADSVKSASEVAMEVAAGDWVPLVDKLEILEDTFQALLRMPSNGVEMPTLQVGQHLRALTEVELRASTSFEESLAIAEKKRKLAAGEYVEGSQEVRLPDDVLPVAASMALLAYDRAAELAGNDEERRMARTGLVRTLVDLGSPVLALDIARQNLRERPTNEAVAVAVDAEQGFLSRRPASSAGVSAGSVCRELLDAGHVQYAFECGQRLERWNARAAEQLSEEILRSGEAVSEEWFREIQAVESIASGAKAAKSCYEDPQQRPSWGTFVGVVPGDIDVVSPDRAAWEVYGREGTELNELLEVLTTNAAIEAGAVSNDGAPVQVVFQAGHGAPTLALAEMRLVLHDWASAYSGLARGAGSPGVSTCLLAYAANECLLAGMMGSICSEPDAVGDYLMQEPSASNRESFVSFGLSKLFYKDAGRTRAREPVLADYFLEAALIQRGFEDNTDACGVAELWQCAEGDGPSKACRKCFGSQ